MVVETVSSVKQAGTTSISAHYSIPSALVGWLAYMEDIK